MIFVDPECNAMWEGSYMKLEKSPHDNCFIVKIDCPLNNDQKYVWYTYETIERAREVIMEAVKTNKEIGYYVIPTK